MALARLEIEIDNYCQLQVVYEDRHGVRTEHTESDAWRMLYMAMGEAEGLFIHQKYHGTLYEIRQAYIDQLDADETMTETAKAKRLGVSPRTLRSIRKNDETVKLHAPKGDTARPATVHLAPHAQEEYEDRALRAATYKTGTDDE